MPVEATEKPLSYKVRDAARLIGISERKLTELISTKQIRSFKIDKSRLITIQAINDYIAKREREAG
jgi:excisionase family DNA binding protein